MQYLALIYGEEGRWVGNLAPEDRDREMDEYMAISAARTSPSRGNELDGGCDRDNRPGPWRRDTRDRRARSRS